RLHQTAKHGLSCILGSGSASEKDGRQNARATAAVKNRRFISEPRYSAFAPDDFTNSAQRAASRLMNSPKASMVIGSAANPTSARRCAKARSASALLSTPLSRAAIGAVRPAGPTIDIHGCRSSPGKNVGSGGTSGKVVSGAEPVTASTLSLPALIGG